MRRSNDLTLRIKSDKGACNSSNDPARPLHMKNNMSIDVPWILSSLTSLTRNNTNDLMLVFTMICPQQSPTNDNWWSMLPKTEPMGYPQKIQKT